MSEEKTQDHAQFVTQYILFCVMLEEAHGLAKGVDGFFERKTIQTISLIKACISGAEDGLCHWHLEDGRIAARLLYPFVSYS